MDRTMSNKIRFFLSYTPLCCGVPRGIHRERISFSSRYVRNSLVRYSPPQSNRRILILFLVCFSTSIQNRQNISNDSDLCFIRQTYSYLDRSSVNVMKQQYPPLALMFIGSHTSVCIRPRISLSLSSFSLKSDLVILPSRQDLQVGNDSQSFISRTYSLINLSHYTCSHDQTYNAKGRIR